MKIFTIHGKAMAYLDVGSGPVILFGHDFLWDNRMWEPQIKALSQSYRCIVPDLWAHGQSEAAPEQTTSLNQYADDILALLDHLAIKQFSIVGLSVGGMWGTDLAIKVPTRIQSLVLMDTFVGLEPESSKEKYVDMLDLIDNASLIPEHLIDIITPIYFSEHAHINHANLVMDFRNQLRKVQGQSAKHLVHVGRLVFDRRDAFDFLETLSMPTLVMVGTKDKARPPLESQLLHDAIIGSQYIVIADAGHISNLEQPEFVTAALSEFFNHIHRNNAD